MKLSAAIAFAASMVVAAPAVAQATQTDFGIHFPLEISGLTAPGPGPFLDVYTFSVVDGTLASAITASGTVIAGAYGLWSNPDTVVGTADDSLLAAWAMNTGVHVMPVTEGYYFYAVGGLDPVGGTDFEYALASAFQQTPAIPEPGSGTLMLAGLGAAALVARRRFRT